MTFYFSTKIYMLLFHFVVTLLLYQFVDVALEELNKPNEFQGIVSFYLDVS